MGLLRKRFLGRYTKLGRLADIGLVASAGLRFAQRRNDPGAAEPISAIELLLAAGAVWRLLRRRKDS